MEEEEMDPYLDPRKATQARQSSAAPSDSDSDDTVSYTKLQLWRTLRALVNAKDGAVALQNSEMISLMATKYHSLS